MSAPSDPCDLSLGELQDIFEGLPDAFLLLDRAWRILHVNSAAERHAGLTRAQSVGREYWDVVPSARGSAIGGLLEQAMASRRTETADVPSALKPGVVVNARVFPVGEGLGLLFKDVTDERAAERRIRESEARFRVLADSMPAPAWTTSAAGPIEFVNRAMAEWVGLPREKLTGDVWLGLLHPDDLPGIVAARAKARAGPDPYVYEARFKRSDGEWRLMQVSSRPRFSDEGVFEGYVGVGIDITEIDAAARRQKILINELNHRVKNTLATVQSIAAQTLKTRPEPDAFRDAFEQRLLSLARAHDLLTKESWSGAEVAEVASRALEPFARPGEGRLVLQGDRLRVGAGQALALALILHELATNAAKYGALSTGAGRLEVRWRAEVGGRAVLTWTESGGPPVAAPARRGFGTRLVERGFTSELGGPVELCFAPQGVTCKIAIVGVEG